MYFAAPGWFRYSESRNCHGDPWMSTIPRNGGRGRWLALLVLPFLALLWLPLYARATPALWGIPFFYWYQFAWVGISALLTAVVYVRTRTPR